MPLPVQAAIPGQSHIQITYHQQDITVSQYYGLPGNLLIKHSLSNGLLMAQIGILSELQMSQITPPGPGSTGVLVPGCLCQPVLLMLPTLVSAGHLIPMVQEGPTGLITLRLKAAACQMLPESLQEVLLPAQAPARFIL